MANVKKELTKVSVARLERFGYELLAVGKTAKDAVSAIMAEYDKTYVDWNGFKSMEDLKASVYYYEEFKADRKQAEEDINIYDMPFGVVEWT